MAKNIVALAEELAQPILNNLGLSLWDVRFLKEGAEWYLRFFIDKEGGVGIDDCEAFSRAIDAPLDEKDFIEQSYILEVCSPGLNRELSKPEHFERCNGERVLLKLFSAVDGEKEFSGILKGFENSEITVEINGEEKVFPKSSVAKICLDDDYEIE